MTTDGQATQDQPLSHDAIVGQDTQHEDQKPLYNKRQVSDVVQRERQKAYEKGRLEAETKAMAQQQVPQAAPQPQQPPQSIGGMPQMSQDDIRKMIYDETPKVLQEQVARVKNQQIVDSFVSKMQAAEAKHPGLEEKLKELDYSTIAPIIQKVNDMENAGDIMKELVDNPMKIGNLTSLIYTQPKLADKAIRDLSNSIKQNEQAKQEHSNVSRDPLSPTNPSPNAGMDNGSMSVSDFRKMFRG